MDKTDTTPDAFSIGVFKLRKISLLDNNGEPTVPGVWVDWDGEGWGMPEADIEAMFKDKWSDF